VDELEGILAIDGAAPMMPTKQVSGKRAVPSSSSSTPGGNAAKAKRAKK
jgi:hypothetical protein